MFDELKKKKQNPPMLLNTYKVDCGPNRLTRKIRTHPSR